MGDVLATAETEEKWPAFPYPGLRPFRHGADGDESYIFHGRDGNIDDVIRRLNESQFVSVVGPSGCGKSSLVKVGVIPALLEGVLTRLGYDFETIEMRPGQDPIGNLAEALCKLNDPAEPAAAMTEPEIAALLRADRSALWIMLDHMAQALARRATSKHTRCVLLLLDQFEEIFSGVQEPAAVDQFVSLITTFFQRPHPQLCIILTMRTDFIGQCANFPGLAEILNKTQYITPVLRGENLVKAITYPAETYGGELEPALIAEIRRDMGSGSSYEADHLPLMQHALLWLWQQAWPRAGATNPPNPAHPSEAAGPVRLTLADYLAHGRLTGILNHHAETIFMGMIAGGDADRRTQIAEVMFRRLTERDTSMRYKRAPEYASRICELAQCSPAELDAVIDPFAGIEASFVERRPGTRRDDPLLDLSHEALIRQWQRLRGWADNEADKAATFRKLVTEAEAWTAQNRSPDYLKSPGQLAALQEWWRMHQPTPAWAERYTVGEGRHDKLSDLFPLVQEYRDASARAVQRARNQRRMRWAALALVGIVVVGAGTALRLWQQAHEARQRIESQVTSAMLQGTDELTRGRASTALEIALAYLKDHRFDDQPQVEALAYHALEQLREERLMRLQHPVIAVDYSPHGRFLVSSGGDGPIVWDTRDGTRHPLFLLDQSNFPLARWSPKGDSIVFTSFPGKSVILLPVTIDEAKGTISQGTPVRLGAGQLDAGSKVGVAQFSSDGSTIVTGGAGADALRAWDAKTGKLLAQQSPSHANDSFSFALSGDGSLVAISEVLGRIDIYKVSTADGTIALLRSVTVDQGRPEAGNVAVGPIRSLAFHPKHANLLLYAQGGHAGIIDLSDGGKAMAIPNADREISQAVFNGDGTLIALATEGGGVSVWSGQPTELAKKGAKPVAVFREHDGEIFGVRFSPDGQHIASGGRNDYTIRIWTIHPVLEPEYPGPPGQLFTMTADGHVVGRASNGQQYSWPVFADHQQLVAFVEAHMPLDGTDRIAADRHEQCLIGLLPADTCMSEQAPDAK